MGREEGGELGWGTYVYLWQIHFDIQQNQYNIVKLNKIKFKKKSWGGGGEEQGAGRVTLQWRNPMNIASVT